MTKPNRGTIYNWMFQQYGTSHRWVIVGTEDKAGERYIRTSLLVKLELEPKTGNGTVETLNSIYDLKQ